MITAHKLEVRAGARLLMSDVSFRVAPGDKVGLVGRNGAGKTTLTKILAGDALPAAGKATRSGSRRSGSCRPAGWTTWSAGSGTPRPTWPRRTRSAGSGA